MNSNGLTSRSKSSFFLVRFAKTKLGFLHNRVKFNKNHVAKTLDKLQNVLQLVAKELHHVLPESSPYLPKILNLLIIELDNLWSAYKDQSGILYITQLYTTFNMCVTCVMYLATQI